MIPNRRRLDILDLREQANIIVLIISTNEQCLAVRQVEVKLGGISVEFDGVDAL